MQFWIFILPLTIKYSWCYESTQNNDFETKVFKTGCSHCLPVNAFASSFLDLICKSKEFVDNSMLIKYAYKSRRTMVTLPGTFGKSINLDMISSFFKLQVKEGTFEKVPQNHTLAYKLFMESTAYCDDGNLRKLENEFLIKKHASESILYELGSVPVIKLNLKTAASVYTMKDVYNFIRNCIETAVLDHIYLEQATTNASNFFSRVKMYRDSLHKLRSYSYDEKKPWAARRLTIVLPDLARILHNIFHHTVFLFVDEYDSLLNRIYFEKNNLDENERHEVATFLGIFFDELLTMCPDVSHVFMTGTICYIDGQYFESLLRMDLHTVASKSEAASFYGLSPEIVVQLLKRNNLQNFSEIIVSERINGYNFGTEDKSLIRYNPYKFAFLLARDELPQNHEVVNWQAFNRSSLQSLIKATIKYQNRHGSILRLILGESIYIASLPCVRISDLDELVKAMSKARIANESDFYSLYDFSTCGFKILYSTGYLTPVKESLKNATRKRAGILVKISNGEAKHAFTQEYYNCFPYSRNYFGDLLGMHQKWRLAIEKCNNALQALLHTINGDAEQFEWAFKDVIEQYPVIKCASKLTFVNKALLETLLQVVINYNSDKSGIEEMERPHLMVKSSNGLLSVFRLKLKRLNKKFSIDEDISDETGQAVEKVEWYLTENQESGNYTWGGFKLISLIVKEAMKIGYHYVVFVKSENIKIPKLADTRHVHRF